MSQENIELFRQVMEALVWRDRASWLALHDEDVELVPIPEWPEPGVRGREAAWDFMVRLIDAFEPISIDDEHVDLVDAGGDKVLVHQRYPFRGKGSGAEVEFEYWLVTTFRRGKVVRGQWFVDRDEALEAAGLEA
jgi:ketosteroid isomerase-like protein